MSLRINHNIAALNGHRNMVRNDSAISKSLEKLSSGMRINRAADDAAGLVISEQMRAQITGLNQAVDNTETAVAMIQTSEGALDEINNLLNKIRELALHASNAGVNDSAQLQADQKELDNAITSITRIAETTQFGTKRLIDGSLAGAQNYDSSVIQKFDVGTELMARSDFIGDSRVSLTIDTSGTATVLSNFQGQVAGANAVTQLTSYISGGGSAFAFDTTGAAISNISGFFGNSNNILAEGASISLTVGGVAYKFENQESAADIISSINSKQDLYDLSLDNGSGLIATRNKLGVAGEYSDVTVSATTGFKAGPSNLAVTGQNLLSATAAQTITRGIQTQASITGLEINGSNITIALNADIDDATILRSNTFGIVIDVTNSFAGITNSSTTFSLTKGALFQVGPNANQSVAVDLKGVKAIQLGLGGDPTGNITSLQSLVSRQSLLNTEFTGTLKVIDKAIDDVTNLRGQLGAFQSNTLETNLNSLRVSLENLTSAESTIRDTDFAGESARFTRNSIMIQASTSMLAQANQLPQNVLQLLQ